METDNPFTAIVTLVTSSGLSGLRGTCGPERQAVVKIPNILGISDQRQEETGRAGTRSPEQVDNGVDQVVMSSEFNTYFSLSPLARFTHAMRWQS